jgi:alpha-glutamyl/putrescinyl thymine pyrophosphorylase clade 1
VIDIYLQFVEERHRIWELRQLGAPQPWTTDSTLATRKFTNVFRVLDPGSQFIFELEDDRARDTLARLFLYRYTNEPATWRYMREEMGDYPRERNLGLAASVMCRYRQTGNRVFSGAYVILPQPNQPGDKVDQACRLTGRWMRKHANDFLAADSQEERYGILRREHGVGPFMAMQILTDWGYTKHCGEDRENEFVVAGPGAIRGAKALSYGDPLRAIRECRLEILLGGEVPAVDGRPPSLMDVQNTLCEFSKYVKGPVARTYRPAHPGEQPDPILPEHFRRN